MHSTIGSALAADEGALGDGNSTQSTRGSFSAGSKELFARLAEYFVEQFVRRSAVGKSVVAAI